ncbi:hypothetical protein [Phenylobacterium sp.]|jgi:hypothetical protein|uniref:hypothetical protein n=1 Tax=Phenylobacterium sp. TaxID=1871053 RepID=UPI002F3FF053
MDIHKPKPWHGLREFLKEIGTIVIGVLIALAAEAVVQKFHEMRQSEEARAAVRDEINLDLANMKRRNTLEPCITRRVAELSDFVARAEAGEPVQPPLTIGAAGHPTVSVDRWEAVTAGGRTSLLSLQEQRTFARIYVLFMAYQANKATEREVWGDLIGLEGVRRPSPELLAQARAALGRARLLDISVRGNLYEASLFAAQIGIKGEVPGIAAQAPQSYKDQAICQPLSMPAEESARLAGPRPLTP